MRKNEKKFQITFFPSLEGNFAIEKLLSRAADLFDLAFFIRCNAQGGGHGVTVGGLLAGAEDKQVIAIRLRFDFRFAVLDSGIFLIDLAADQVVNVFLHILPQLILSEFDDYANKKAPKEIRPSSLLARVRLMELSVPDWLAPEVNRSA